MARKSSQMQRLRMGILLGMVAGLLAGFLTMALEYGMKEHVAIFIMWVSGGIIIAHTKLKIKGAYKGIVLALLMFIPMVTLMAWGHWLKIIPLVSINAIFCAFIGGFIKKYAK